jgi:predicted signal transduction protein with EAL and GGDEF domain
MRRADVALYAGKEQGKNCVVVFHDDLHARMVQRISARAALQRGLDYEEFVVLYQPIVALDTGRIVRAEALLRWEDPERGMAAGVVPLAEKADRAARALGDGVRVPSWPPGEQFTEIRCGWG